MVADRQGRRLVFLQLNELNFEFVARYAELGMLPGFARLFDRHGFVRTTSETRHELANPWIQWPTVHTGRDYADHGVFRLGDILDCGLPQIYETLESHGVSIGAISPFNAANRTGSARFFVPDPWTRTRFVGSRDLRRLYDALVAVSDAYASERVTPATILNLALGTLPNLRMGSIPTLTRGTLDYLARRRKWWRAVVCDRVLGDAFLRHWRRDKPDFGTLFLNGGAHLQHHYLFSSAAYDGERRNPEWQVPADCDPLLDILRCYDALLVELRRALGEHRLIIATGLHQAPHERITYYYRIDDHVDFLARIGIEYRDTQRLMTEDFVVHFADEQAAEAAERKLLEVRSAEGHEIFYVETGDSAHRTDRTWDRLLHVENRGKSLYVQLRPVREQPPAPMSVRSGNVVVEGFDRMISFAQFKNTHHVGEGYYTDTDFAAGELPDSFPLHETFDVILDHFGIDPARACGRAVPQWLAQADAPSRRQAAPGQLPRVTAARAAGVRFPLAW